MEQRLLLFTVAGQGYALDLQEVAEVMEPQPSYPIPRVPDHFMGLINFHGALTALVDLGLFLGFGSPRRPEGKVLVLDTRLAGLALLVDGVTSAILAETVLSRTPSEEELTEALLETPLGNYRLIKAEALLGALEHGLAEFLPPPHGAQAATKAAPEVT